MTATTLDPQAPDTQPDPPKRLFGQPVLAMGQCPIINKLGAYAVGLLVVQL